MNADDERRPEGARAAEEPWKSLGAEMREARECSGWTAADLARKIPCHPSTLSNIERGRDHPSREIVEAYDERFSPRGEETRLRDLRAQAAEADEREKRAKRAEKRRGRSAEVDARLSADRRGRARMLLLLVVLVVVAGIGGYALFREPPTRPAASGSAMVREGALAQSFVISINQLLDRLGDSRGEARRQLAEAKTGPKQAAAARKLASAYRATAGEVPRLSVAPPQQVPARAISESLKRAGRAYADLAAAAKTRNVRRYKTARRAIEVEEAALGRQLLRSGLATR